MHKVHSENLSSVEKRALWDKIIADYISSGDSIKHYSQYHGLQKDHLSYYVSSYRRKHRTTETSFVTLPATLNTSSAAIRVQFGAVSIELPSGIPIQHIADLAKQLSC